MLMGVPIGVEFGTTESEDAVMLIWVPIGVYVGIAEGEACSDIDTGTNWR